jgi:hypothetical protein
MAIAFLLQIALNVISLLLQRLLIRNVLCYDSANVGPGLHWDKRPTLMCSRFDSECVGGDGTWVHQLLLGVVAQIVSVAIEAYTCFQDPLRPVFRTSM